MGLQFYQVTGFAQLARERVQFPASGSSSKTPKRMGDLEVSAGKSHLASFRLAGLYKFSRKLRHTFE